jgi:transposase
VNHARHLFETVHALTDTGRAYNSVASELGLDWRTVRKYATASSWQECVRRRPRVPSPLDRYKDYLQQRWDEGEHTAKVLHEELKAKGYLGHYQRVKMAVAPLRRGLPGRSAPYASAVTTRSRPVDHQQPATRDPRHRRTTAAAACALP